MGKNEIFLQFMNNKGTENIFKLKEWEWNKKVSGYIFAKGVAVFLMK